MIISASSMAAICYHNDEDSATELSQSTADGEIIILRICGVDGGAFFELINDFGDPMGDVFDEIEVNPVY